MDFKRRRVMRVIGGASLAALAGCTASSSSEGSHSDGHGHGHGESSGEPTDRAEVAMKSSDGGQHFDPHVVRIKPGGTVRWSLASGSHSTTAYHPENDEPQLVPDGAAAWDSGVLSETGATFEHAFETEGVYHYYCTPHESMGMIGSVIVGAPDPSSQPALKSPPEELSQTVREKIERLNEKCRNALSNSH